MENTQKEILTMLAEGKIDIEKAESLLAASKKETQNLTQKDYKFFHIVAEGESEKERVDIKVPLKLLKSGVKWMSFIPNKAIEKIQSKLHSRGIEFDLKDLTSEGALELVESLQDIEVNAEVENQGSVRIYCS